MKGRDDDVGPELRSVLANTPALVLQSSGASRHLQLALGFARRDCLCRIEDREVLSNDLGACVPFQTRCPRAPRQHASGCIERKNRVILNAFRQQTIDVVNVRRWLCVTRPRFSGEDAGGPPASSSEGTDLSRRGVPRGGV